MTERPNPDPLYVPGPEKPYARPGESEPGMVIVYLLAFAFVLLGVALAVIWTATR